MKGSEISLMKFMEGSSKRFVIPVYQRNYDWKIANCTVRIRAIKIDYTR